MSFRRLLVRINGYGTL